MPACVFASLGCAFSSLHLLTRRTRGDICQHNRARLDEVEKHFPAVRAEAEDGAVVEEARGADLADTPLTPPRNWLSWSESGSVARTSSPSQAWSTVQPCLICTDSDRDHQLDPLNLLRCLS